MILRGLSQQSPSMRESWQIHQWSPPQSFIKRKHRSHPHRGGFLHLTAIRLRCITYGATILDMRTTAALLTVLVLVLPVVSQTAKPVPPAAKVPVAPAISDAQRAAYWKAIFQQQVAQKQRDEAGTAFSQSVQSMSETCGKDATLQQATNGDPVCVLKPAEKK